MIYVIFVEYLCEIIQVANFSYIRTKFKQVGDVCLLASYYAVLDYYQNVDGNISEYNIDKVYNLFRQYIEFIEKQLSVIPSECIPNRGLIDNLLQYEGNIGHELTTTPTSMTLRRNFENYVCNLLYAYCKSIRLAPEAELGIHGYEHIKEFDDFLIASDFSLRTKNFIIVEYNIADYKKETNIYIPNAYETISSHLEKAEHNIAMILFQSGVNFHSIMITKDSEGIIYVDSNNQGPTRDQAVTANFIFHKQSQILEYILFSEVDFS